MIEIDFDHRVQWDSLPVQLRPQIPTTFGKIRSAVWNIFSVVIPIIGLIRLIGYGLGLLAKRILLPASGSSDHLKRLCSLQLAKISHQKSAHFQVTPHTIITPDGAALSATLFQSHKGRPNTPTIIYFLGNGALRGMGGWEWILDESIKKNSPINLVIFDYRSVNESTGTFSEDKDLIVDGCSMVDWVENQIGTPGDRIHLYGSSLGGAVALKTKAAHPHVTGWLVNERSFSSLESVIQTLPFFGWINQLAIWLCKHNRLELNITEDVPRLAGRNLFVYHPEDTIIPLAASASRLAPNHRLALDQTTVSESHHNESLTEYPLAQQAISEFIFTN